MIPRASVKKKLFTSLNEAGEERTRFRRKNLARYQENSVAIFNLPDALPERWTSNGLDVSRLCLPRVATRKENLVKAPAASRFKKLKREKFNRENSSPSRGVAISPPFPFRSKFKNSKTINVEEGVKNRGTLLP